jgi:hypothetical protein
MKCSLCSKDFIPGVEEQDTCEQCLPSLILLTDNKGKDEYQVDHLMDDIPEMSNSPLVSYTRLSPNNSGLRTHKIDTITPHCVVGHASLQTLGNIFAPIERRASSNYGIDDHGNVGMYVEEKNRSWCSSSESNDQRAITIEIASDNFYPYKITDKALNGLINLCVDICSRNNIPKLLWKADKSLIGQIDKQNITVHRWFSPRECPGEYIYENLGMVADEVNKILYKPEIVLPKFPYLVIIDTYALNYRRGPGMNHPINGVVHRNEVYTIVEEADGPGASKWGKLKSGAGWISLDFVKKMR